MSSASSKNYSGKELDLFAHALNWKDYWSKTIEPFIGENILEVGAGIGTNTNFLLDLNDHIGKWVCLEPDRLLAEKIESNIDVDHRAKVKVFNKSLDDFESNEKFDTVLYIDVLEHIRNDKKEIEHVKRYLKSDGYLIILVPAHNFLFSEFDQSIGHFRRYNKKMIKEVINNTLEEEKLIYLDTVGMATSIANKTFLRQPYPTLKQIKFWDKVMVNASKWIDPLLGHQVGRSLLGVWRKTSIQIETQKS